MSGNKVSLIGVSNFLGRATAYLLLKGGYTVSITSRDAAKLHRIKDEFHEYGNVLAVPGEISNQKSADSLMEEVNAAIEGIDHLVVMVGGFAGDTISDLSAMDQMLHNHIKIPAMVVKATQKYLHRGSSVVLITSIGALEHGDPRFFSYSIGKAGLAKMTEVLSSELIGMGVRVNAVAPNFIDGSFEPGREWRNGRKLGDLKTPPEDVALVIKWLISEDSDWVNGALIPVDGGHRLRKQSRNIESA